MEALERALHVRTAQDRALVRYLRDQVTPYSPAYGDLLLGFPVQDRHDLQRLPLTRLDDVVEPAAYVLRPTAERIERGGDPVMRLRWLAARTIGRAGRFNREVVEPTYKPVHWHHEDLPIGYSAEDLERLSEIGRTALELAGLDPYDVLVSVYPPGPTTAFWQLALGARRAGVSHLLLGPEASPVAVARLRPSVLAGRTVDLLALLEAGRSVGLSFAELHTVIAIGAPLDVTVRSRLADLGGRANRSLHVVAWWAPPGLRAVWAECREGIDVHTWPAHELLELVDPASGAPRPTGSDGEVVWTPLGWKGTVLLRLRTGVVASVDDTPCVACGRALPRVRIVSSLPPFARVLDEHPGVQEWHAELRTVDGEEELIVFLAPASRGHPGRLVRELDRQLSVTQFVVLPASRLRRRIDDAGGSRVLDLRG